MGKSKKQVEAAPAPAGVDMERIKKMMGPLPNERAEPEVVDEIPEATLPTTAPEIPQSEDIAAAAEEANATLKAMAAELENKDEVNSPDDSSVVEPELSDEGIVADNPVSDAAIDEILASESDEILIAEDEEKAEEEELAEPHQHGFKAWLKNVLVRPAVRWTIFGVIVAVIAAVAIIPVSRYFVLNTVGVRGSASLTVLDTGTQLPLKNVAISVAGQQATTDENGTVTFKNMKLGATTLHISKRAFRDITHDLTLGWGSNPLGQFSMNPTGAQYTFFVKDFLTGKPVEKAEASSGEGNALSDKNGKIILTLDTRNKKDEDEISVAIGLDGYRQETVKIMVATKAVTNIKMVAAQKDLFISDRSGKYDIYSVDIDGKNEKKLVSGTGLERDDLALAPQSGSDMAAYVATRENVKNKDGFLLSTLYILDESTAKLQKIDQSEQIQLVGWSKDGRLVYVKIAAGTSAGNAERVRLVTVNPKNASDTKEIAKANYFNDVVMAGDKVLYAPSNAFGDSKPGFYVVNTDGTNAQTITNKQVYTIFRNDANMVTIHADENYYTYPIGGSPASLSVTTTPNQKNLLFIDNQSGMRSLWTDTSDGKTVLYSYDKSTKKSQTLIAAKGMKLPVRWLTDKIAVYRVSDSEQTADYVVNIDGGQPVKITNLTDVRGISRWYYY